MMGRASSTFYKGGGLHKPQVDVQILTEAQKSRVSVLVAGENFTNVQYLKNLFCYCISNSPTFIFSGGWEG